MAGIFAGVGTAGVSGLFSAIGAWLMSDDEAEREERRLEVEVMLDRERRRLPDFAYERIKGLITGSVKPSGMGAGSPTGGTGASPGAFRRVVGGGGGMGAPKPAGGGMQPRLSPSVSPMRPERNPQLRTFLGGG